MKSVPLAPETLGKYDAVLIATDHSSYDFSAIVNASKLVIDTRNATRNISRFRERIVPC
jgi:UDP-N-acetyl-D-glucosamine dehydrogenase